MPRYTIDGSPIHVAYGLDNSAGIFLSVFDDRLAYDETASYAVNKVTESIGVKDGGGSYFDLHTGPIGFGEKVSIATIVVFLKRYGIPEKHIESLVRGKEIVETIEEPKEKNNEEIPCSLGIQSTEHNKKTHQCFACDKDCSKTCIVCHSAFYCSKECQTKDFKNHKFICSPTVYPSKVHKKSVYGLFLPEDIAAPRIVEIPLVREIDSDDGQTHFRAVTDSFVTDISIIYAQVNPLRPNRIFADTFIIEFRDNFLFDGSIPNKTIKKITNNQNGHDWRGPVLVTKAEGKDQTYASAYLDVELSDFNNIIDYFTSYGKH